MKTVNLSNFEAVLSYDGIKLAADFDKYFLYVWNNYSENTDWDSDWVILNCSESVDTFVNYFKGESTLLNVFENSSLNFGRLQHDLETLQIDCSYRFKITMPSALSFLKKNGQNFKAKNITLGSADYSLYFENIKFGSHVQKIETFINKRLLRKGVACANDEIWEVFFKQLTASWTNLFHRQSRIVMFDDRAMKKSSTTESNKNKIFFSCYSREKNNGEIAFYARGKQFFIEYMNKACIIDYEEAKNIFTNIGECLASQLKKSTKSNKIFSKWDSRNKKRSFIDQLQIDVDLNESYKKTYNYIIEREQSFSDEQQVLSPLRAAARMTHGCLSDAETLEILKAVDAKAGQINTEQVDSQLEELVKKIPASVNDSTIQAFEQGYILANFLRKEFSIDGPVASLNPILLELGVVQDECIFPPKVWALAIWGSRNTFILLNTHSSALGTNNNTIRSTLAHELAHILVDRRKSLPVVEVLLKNEREEFIERRAKAFAAEFLFPRTLVVEEINNSTSSPNVHNLAKNYGVSEELTAWQIINAERAGLHHQQNWLEEARKFTKS